MSQPEFETFHTRILIKEHHLDTFGHVNNAVYLTLLEEARWDFIVPRGFGISEIQRMGLGPTVLEWSIKFKKEIKLRDTIIIESQGVSYDKKIGVLRQDILNEQAEICCQALMTMGLFDTKARKLVLPTAEWLHAIGMKSIAGI